MAEEALDLDIMVDIISDIMVDIMGITEDTTEDIMVIIETIDKFEVI
jgi:hypothetical protein